jgi:hypothetical protein
LRLKFGRFLFAGQKDMGEIVFNKKARIFGKLESLIWQVALLSGRWHFIQ